MKSRMVFFPAQGQAALGEIEIPAPARGELLVHNLGCGVCQAEIKEFLGLFGHPYPLTRLGHEGIGRVVGMGPEVAGFREGDLVTTLWHPAFQEYNVVRADWAYVLPESAARDPAVWISEPAACALNGALAAAVEPGQRVLLLGAGYMGLLLVQCLRRAPLGELVVADLEPSRLQRATELGATAVVHGADLPACVKERGGFDVVIEATGAANMIAHAADYLALRGRLVVFADHAHHTETVPWARFGAQCLTVVFANPMLHRDFPENWRAAVRLMLDGKIDQSRLITHRLPAAQCQELMGIAASRRPEYVKGYLSWK